MMITLFSHVASNGSVPLKIPHVSGHVTLNKDCKTMYVTIHTAMLIHSHCKIISFSTLVHCVVVEWFIRCVYCVIYSLKSVATENFDNSFGMVLNVPFHFGNVSIWGHSSLNFMILARIRNEMKTERKIVREQYQIREGSQLWVFQCWPCVIYDLIFLIYFL